LTQTILSASLYNFFLTYIFSTMDKFAEGLAGAIEGYSPISFTEVVYRAHCEFPGGIPSGYKWGEPDATFGSIFPADTIGSAVRYIQESVLHDRAKQGWEPLKPPITELIDLQVP
jgi:hypothetical protein